MIVHKPHIDSNYFPMHVCSALVEVLQMLIIHMGETFTSIKWEVSGMEDSGTGAFALACAVVDNYLKQNGFVAGQIIYIDF